MVECPTLNHAPVTDVQQSGGYRSKSKRVLFERGLEDGSSTGRGESREPMQKEQRRQSRGAGGNAELGNPPSPLRRGGLEDKAAAVCGRKLNRIL